MLWPVGFKGFGLGGLSLLTRNSIVPQDSVQHEIPIVSIVVPFCGFPFRILTLKLVKPQNTTMETRGNMLQD